MKEQDVHTKVKAIKWFYSEIMSYILVNALFILFWVIFNKSGIFWPKYLLLVWGIILFFKAYYMKLMPFLFSHISFLSPEWEEKKINEIIGNEIIGHRHLQGRIPLSRDTKK